MSMPRSEYPRPQFVRKDWACLNGEWQFEMDQSDTGLERGIKDRDLAERITVPFCPESELSGIGNVDFMDAVWYRRELTVPADWAGQLVHLHFQAVDYDATVWVNGREVMRHRGGFAPFVCDITECAAPGETAVVVVRARDKKGMAKPGGKQSMSYAKHGCMYTRTTGIWQTVWMEPVPRVHLRRPRITPDVANRRFRLELPLSNNPEGFAVRAVLKDADNVVADVSVPADYDLAPSLDLVIPEEKVRLWDTADPHLYSLVIELINAEGEVVDCAESYAGLRSVAIDGKVVKINGKPVFQRLVLDQGYYPDGILTAPSEEALVADIELSIAAGFNGARLHEKVFEERFLYHADRLGYLCWGEFADWGIDRDNPPASYTTQWLEVISRDYNHPAIIGWCGLNETAKKITDEVQGLDDLTLGFFLAAKALDRSRPIIDASGYSHRVLDTDIYDSHDYEQDPAAFKKQQEGIAQDKPFRNDDHCPTTPWNLPYRGQPYFCSEFGGILWNPKAAAGDAAWGYGKAPQSIEEFYERFDKLCGVLLEDPNMFGYCYTQLTDVFQEQNGIYYFDRSPKFDMDRIRASQQKPAAIEMLP